MKKATIALLLHLMAAFASGQTVKLPAEIKGSAGAWIIVAPVCDGGIPKWRIDPALQEVDLKALLPESFVAQLKGRVFTSTVDGKFKIECWNAKGDVASDIATTWIIVGIPPPPIPPVPPVPPIPPVPPVPPPPPPNPSPFPGDGLRVFILWDDKGAKLPEDQQEIIFGPDVRHYLDAKCPVGPDGKTQEYRMWPLKDGKIDGTAPKLWADALARPRASLPWVIVGNGKDGFEGPLPKNKDEFLTIVKKFGG